jgi:spore coat protein U-like protein
MKKFLLLTAIASVASVAAVAPAMADVTTAGTFTLGATTTKLCIAPSASNIALGEYNGTVAVTGTTTIKYKCTNSTPSTLTITSANGGLLKDGANSFAYTGSAAAPGNGFGVNASAANVTSVYTATVAADLAPVPGNYTDTLSVVVNY